MNKEGGTLSEYNNIKFSINDKKSKVLYFRYFGNDVKCLLLEIIY